VGGLVGAILTGVFADPAIWKPFGGSYAGALYGKPGQLPIQLLACGITIALAFLGSLLIFKLIDLTIGARVDAKSEAMGLDITQHHERAYTVID
jgi:ammonium transporter, Amt family